MSTSLPTPRDSEAKLEHILRHAAQIFAERGFEGASIRDISRASGVSLAGLYYYFDSKQELLYLIQNATFSRVLDSVRVRLSGRPRADCPSSGAGAKPRRVLPVASA